MAIPVGPVRIGRFLLRPYDPKCREYVDDPDGVIEGDIRIYDPVWSGDFADLRKAVLALPHVTAKSLPRLTVDWIVQALKAASPKPVPGRSTTVVANLDGSSPRVLETTPTEPAADDETSKAGWAVSQLKSEDGSELLRDIIQAFHELGAYDGSTRTAAAAYHHATGEEVSKATREKPMGKLQILGVIEPVGNAGWTLTSVGKIVYQMLVNDQPSVTIDAPSSRAAG